MYGLINRSIQCFLRDMYGHEIWIEVSATAGLGPDGFEALLSYEDELTDKVLSAASLSLEKPVNVVLEDLGTYLVSHPNCEPLRRLLRFGGPTFTEFLYSLDDLQGRAKLAAPEIELPLLDLHENGSGNFTLYCSRGHRGFGNVFVGILRAMADDYGALVMLEHLGSKTGVENISIQILESSFAKGKSFDLGAGVAG